MKKFVLPVSSLFLTLCFLACNNADQPQNANPPKDTAAAAAPEAGTDTVKGNLMELASLNGQYPTDVALLDNPLLTDRLKTLLGDDYADFRKYWNTETPIVVEDNVLSTTGCEQHNCAGNQYVLQIDLQHNNINVYHFGKDIKSYKEKGTITLPPNLAKEFEIMMGNRPV